MTILDGFAFTSKRKVPLDPQYRELSLIKPIARQRLTNYRSYETFETVTGYLTVSASFALICTFILFMRDAESLSRIIGHFAML